MYHLPVRHLHSSIHPPSPHQGALSTPKVGASPEQSQKWSSEQQGGGAKLSVYELPRTFPPDSLPKRSSGGWVSQRLQLAAPKMQRLGGGLQETGPEHPGSPTLSLQAHGLRQLSVTSPQEDSSPFTSNQVLGNVQGLRKPTGEGAEKREKLVLWKEGKCP